MAGGYRGWYVGRVGVRYCKNDPPVPPEEWDLTAFRVDATAASGSAPCWLGFDPSVVLGCAGGVRSPL